MCGGVSTFGNDHGLRVRHSGAAAGATDDGNGAQKVVPAARATCLDDVGGVIAIRRVGPALDLGHFASLRDATSVRRQVGTKDVRDEHEFVLDADGARGAGLFAEVARSAHEFWVRVAHLVLTQATATVFVDEMLACQAMIDGARAVSTAQRTRTERSGAQRHGERLPTEYPP